MSWLRHACLACSQAQQEITYLREQLAKAEARVEALQDRFLAVVDRHALAAVVESRNPEPPRTWASDEHGTSFITPEGEKEMLFDQEGEPCVSIDGELIKVREYDHWMQRLHQAAAGVRPGDVE